jgi:hypothetical protein
MHRLDLAVELTVMARAYLVTELGDERGRRVRELYRNFNDIHVSGYILTGAPNFHHLE